MLRLFLLVISIVVVENVKAQTVYITKSGEKYHKEGCKYLKYSKKEIKLEEAISRGYEACKVCKPSYQKSKTATSTPLTSGSKNTTASSKKATSSQCIGRTKAGRRCKRTTKNINGRCYQHQ